MPINFDEWIENAEKKRKPVRSNYVESEPVEEVVKKPLPPVRSNYVEAELDKDTEKSYIKGKGKAKIDSDGAAVLAPMDAPWEDPAPPQATEGEDELIQRLLENDPEPEIEEEEVAPAPQQQAPQQEVSRQPASEEGFPWDRALIGATPLLVGMLTGNTLEGVGTSAKYLTETETDLYKRKNDLDYKLAEMAAKQKMAGPESLKRRFSPQRAENKKTGEVTWLDYDTFKGGLTKVGTGEPINPDDWVVGYAANPHNESTKDVFKRSYRADSLRNNPETGEADIYGNMVDNARNRSNDPERVTVKDSKDLEKIRGEIRSNETVKRLNKVGTTLPEIRSKIIAARRFIDPVTGEVSKPNATAAESVRFELAKAIQGAGVLTDRDVDRLGGDTSLKESARRLKEKQVKGTTLTEKDAKEYMELVDIYEANLKRNLKSLVNNSIKAYRVSYPKLTDAQIKMQLLPTLGPLLDSVGINKEKLMEAMKPKVSMPKVIYQNGHKYEWNEKAGKYE